MTSEATGPRQPEISEDQLACTDQCNLALPEPPQPKEDRLLASIDFYEESIILTNRHNDRVITRPIQAQALVETLSRQATFNTGLLSSQTLWVSHRHQATETALWQPPRVRKITIFTNPQLPPLTMNLPLPGLVFLCSPQRAPTIFAARRRPKELSERLYHAPLFNIFGSGASCPGSHHYPQDVRQIPNSFFEAHFSSEGDSNNRSVKHPNNLFHLWQEINNTRTYPKADLIPAITVEDLMKSRSN